MNHQQGFHSYHTLHYQLAVVVSPELATEQLLIDQGFKQFLSFGFDMRSELLYLQQEANYDTSGFVTDAEFPLDDWPTDPFEMAEWNDELMGYASTLKTSKQGKLCLCVKGEEYFLRMAGIIASVNISDSAKDLSDSKEILSRLAPAIIEAMTTGDVYLTELLIDCRIMPEYKKDINGWHKQR